MPFKHLLAFVISLGVFVLAHVVNVPLYAPQFKWYEIISFNQELWRQGVGFQFLVFMNLVVKPILAYLLTLVLLLLWRKP